MRLYLSRELSGQYTLNAEKPVLCRIEGTDSMNFYQAHGEPIGLRHLCPMGTKALFGFELKRLQTVEVELVGTKIEP